MIRIRKEFTAKEAKAYGIFLGERFQTEPHILWILDGDAKAAIKGYDKNGKYQHWDMKAIFRSMAEGIVAWLDANGVEVWREVDLVYPTMMDDYRLNHPIKPILFLEGSSEFGSYRHECGWITPLKVRRQIYHTFFAGGAGHTYGAGPIWPMRGTEGDYSCGYNWKQALDFPGGANFAGVAKAFLQQHNWAQWIPDPSILERGAGAGESLKTAVTLESSQLALVYFSNNSHAKIKNPLNKAAVAHWFDPRNRKEVQPGNIQAKEVQSFIPANGWEDAILILRVKD